MQKLRAFYFSGTGNTKYVVSYLADKLKGSYDVKVFDITEECVFEREISVAHVLLFAFPIYGSSPPIPMRNFIHKYSKLLSGKTVAIAETQYFFSGDGAASVGRTLIKFGADVRFAEHFNMPNNLADGSVFRVRNGDELDKRLQKTVARMDAFADNIISGRSFRRGFGLVSHAIGYYGQRKWWRRGEKAKRNAVKVDPFRCVGCGLCAKYCPTHNLEVLAKLARPNGNCVFCYRCVNLCPRGAITICGKQVVARYKGIPSDDRNKK